MNKTFKIVKIINEYKVVVNAGANDYIQEDQHLEVYEPGQEIIDPDTKEILGSLDFIKAKLRVENVFPKMCICVNRETETTSWASAVENMFTTSKIAPLKVDSKDISGGFENVNKKIQIGDLVRVSN